MSSFIRPGMEWVSKFDMGANSLEFGLQTSDQDFDEYAPSHEPGNANYARVTDSVSYVQSGNDFGVENDSVLSFDFSDVDSGDSEDVTIRWGIAVLNFDSTEGGGVGDWVVSEGSISNFNTGDVESFRIDAGEFHILLS